MKKLTLVLLILILSFSLYSAKAPELEFSLGMRESATEDLLPTLGILYSTEYIDVGFRYHTPKQIDFATSLNLTLLKYIKQNVHLHLTHIADNGGTISLSYGIGGEFSFFKDQLILGLMVKGQAALGYSLFSEYMPVGLSWDYRDYIAYKGDMFEAEAYFAFSTFFDRVWKAAPIIGLNFAYNISERNQIGLFGNIFYTDFTFSDYSFPTISGGTFGFLYKWRTK